MYKDIYICMYVQRFDNDLETEDLTNQGIYVYIYIYVYLYIYVFICMDIYIYV
jgi:hypothetical protein